MIQRSTLTVLAAAILASSALAQDFSKIPTDALTKEQRADAKGMIDRDIQKRTKEFNVRHREEWYKIKTRDQWEKYRDERIARLRQSLGEWPAPARPNVKVTSVIKGDGFNVENVAYESRPGFWVAGNLYVPATPSKSMPGMLIAHAHHNGKRQSELQDMGMLWARSGCVVLVIDQVGYGERRAHPFSKDADYDKPYKVGRQDYYFRYDNGVQLQLLGDSLMGWFAWDYMRGVDLLLAREGVDAKRIAILGAVAGGGDPAGVTAALDPRITCCAPFNFGGPQPETKYPLPDDAETSFNYLLFTYWDSTRGLRLGASGDFPHWVITASIAPRHLIHGHEFAWDGQRDPVWKRYQKVWGDFYQAGERIGVAHGKGILKLRPPEASHCNHIGEFHRRMIHPLFDKWWGVKAQEYSMPRKGDELICFTEEARKSIQPKSLNVVMDEIAAARLQKARGEMKDPDALRKRWSDLLGPIAPAKAPVVQAKDAQTIDNVNVERLVLEVEPGIVVPVTVIAAPKRARQAPVVIGLAQAGKAGFLKERSADLRKLVDAGVIIVLPDLRGTGETQVGTSRGKDSSGTNHSVHVQLFGETLLGQRLRDLRSVMAYLRTRDDVNSKSITLWGDSFAPTNSATTNFKVPHGEGGWPTHAEPLGGLLGLFGALYETDVRAVYVSGSLTSYRSVLGHHAVLIPHDAAVPGALTAGDLCDLAGAVAPRPLRLEGMVDHLNRPASAAALDKEYASTVRAYEKRPQAFSFAAERSSAAGWILEQLK